MPIPNIPHTANLNQGIRLTAMRRCAALLQPREILEPVLSCYARLVLGPAGNNMPIYRDAVTSVTKSDWAHTLTRSRSQKEVGKQQLTRARNNKMARCAGSAIVASPSSSRPEPLMRAPKHSY